VIAELSDIMTSFDGDLPDASQSATEAGAIDDWHTRGGDAQAGAGGN
jgi:hypothetical protein